MTYVIKLIPIQRPLPINHRLRKPLIPHIAPHLTIIVFPQILPLVIIKQPPPQSKQLLRLLQQSLAISISAQIEVEESETAAGGVETVGLGG